MSVSRRVRVLLALLAGGIAALALALILESDALVAAGVLMLVTAVTALLAVALFSRHPPARGRSESPTFLIWLWRRTRPSSDKRHP